MGQHGPLGQRFWARVSPCPITGCWWWTGPPVDRFGYGQVAVTTGKPIRAHRAAWTLIHGSIPPGMCVLHRCDQPACVNPDHLFLGTHQENVADKVKKGRQSRGDTSPGKLTTPDVMSIRSEYARGRSSQASIARRFGVSQKAISMVVRRRSWAHVE